MKSIKSIIFSGSFIIALMMLSVNSVQAQAADKVITQEKISPVQAGTAQMVNGSLTVTLSETTLKQLSTPGATYFVSLTPIGDCGQLKLQQKGNNNFTVQELAKTASNGTFDYVVMVKKTVISGLKHETQAK